MADVKVRFTAENEASEVFRRALDLLRQFQREGRSTNATTQQMAGAARQAADGFQRMSRGLAGIRATGGVDAISRRVAILSQGLHSASTRAESLTRLAAIESQLQKAVQRSNLSLTDRIRLEETLRQTQGALGGGAAPTGLAAAAVSAQRLQTGLAALGVAIGARKVLQLAKDAVDTADALNDLSQRTGVGVEALSVLTAEAGKTGASTDALEIGFRNLSKSVEGLRAGNAEAVESFRALGLSAHDLEGLSLDQVFVKVADAQTKLDAGSTKATLAMRILGRAGDELIPLLNQLANGGFDRARAEAERLGAVVREDAARAADALNDAIADLNRTLRGFSAELVGSLGPLTGTIEAVTGFLANLPPGLKAFVAGATIATTAATALAAGIGVLTIALGALAAVTGVGAIVAVIGGIALLGGTAAVAASQFQDLNAALEKDEHLARLVAGAKVSPTVGDSAAVKATRSARLGAARKQADDERAIVDARLKETAQLEDAAFAQGLTALREHFQNRAEITKQGTANEIRALQANLSALRASPLSEDSESARIERGREIATIEAQIARAKIDGESALLALVEQERVARQQAFTEAKQFQAQAFRLQGEELRATQIEIAQSAERFAQVLRTLGIDGGVVTEIQGAFSTLLTDRAVVQDQLTKGERELTAIALERERINAQIVAGTLSERDGVLAIADAERRHIGTLTEVVRLAREFAARVGDPALIQAVEAFAQRFANLGQVTSRASKLAKDLKDTLLAGAESDLSQFLGSTINQVHGVTDALVQLAASVAQSFQRTIGELLSAQLFERIRGSLDGKGLVVGGATVGVAAGQLSQASDKLIAGAAALAAAAIAMRIAMSTDLTLDTAIDAVGKFIARGHARGGPVPGTGTRDSVPAMLMPGEYVLRTRAVRRVGVAYLDALNGLRTPRVRSLDQYGVPQYAAGGLVTAGAARSQSATFEGDLRFSVEHSEGTIIRLLESPAGVRVLTTIAQRNRTTLRRALGV